MPLDSRGESLLHLPWSTFFAFVLTLPMVRPLDLPSLQPLKWCWPSLE